MLLRLNFLVVVALASHERCDKEGCSSVNGTQLLQIKGRASAFAQESKVGNAAEPEFEDKVHRRRNTCTSLPTTSACANGKYGEKTLICSDDECQMEVEVLFKNETLLASDLTYKQAQHSSAAKVLAEKGPDKCLCRLDDPSESSSSSFSLLQEDATSGSAGAADARDDATSKKADAADAGALSYFAIAGRRRRRRRPSVHVGGHGGGHVDHGPTRRRRRRTRRRQRRRNTCSVDGSGNQARKTGIPAGDKCQTSVEAALDASKILEVDKTYEQAEFEAATAIRNSLTNLPTNLPDNSTTGLAPDLTGCKCIVLDPNSDAGGSSR